MQYRRYGPVPFDDTEAWVLVVTTCLSHISVAPALGFLFKQRWLVEFSVGVFCLVTSVMYHLADCFNRRFFLSELQWHRLDNIAALSAFGVLFTHLADIGGRHHAGRQLIALATIFVSMVVQERDPWNEWYTFVPIACFIAIPVAAHAWRLQWPRYRRKLAIRGAVLMLMALAGFVLGLDDRNDRWKLFHGGWHFFGGLAMYDLWRLLPAEPGSTAASKRRGMSV